MKMANFGMNNYSPDSFILKTRKKLGIPGRNGYSCRDFKGKSDEEEKTRGRGWLRSE